MRKKHLLIFFLFLLSKPLISQDTSFMAKIKIPPVIDTLFIDHDRNNWSIRLFTNYKDNKFKLSNTDHSVLYTPHNPFGFGFGLGTRKVLLDIAFNIKVKDKEPTERFDLQATLMLNNHQLNFTIQRYQGFNVNDGSVDEFRTDITSLSSGLVYMYMFNTSEYSMAAIKSGLSKQKKSAFTSGLGGFIFMNRISADSSIIPPELYHLFNEEARIVNLPGIGAGGLVNLSATVPFFKNFFATAKVNTGIGLMYKYVETETVSYHPTDPLLYQLDLGVILGYNANRYYINFSMGYTLFGTSLGYNNRMTYNTAKAKLALGYKLGRNRK